MESGPGEQAPTLVQVREQTRYLLGNFIESRMLQDGFTKLPDLNYLIGEGPFHLPSNNLKTTIQCIQRIADEIDQDHRFLELINRVPPDAEESILLAVVNIFSKGGRWNWANVIILFYFGYGLCKRAYDRFPLMQATVNFIVDYIHDHVAPWIVANGGWVALENHVYDHKRSLAVRVVKAVVGIGAAAAAAVAIIYYFRSR